MRDARVARAAQPDCTHYYSHSNCSNGTNQSKWHSNSFQGQFEKKTVSNEAHKKDIVNQDQQLSVTGMDYMRQTYQHNYQEPSSPCMPYLALGSIIADEKTVLSNNELRSECLVNDSDVEIWKINEIMSTFETIPPAKSNIAVNITPEASDEVTIMLPASSQAAIAVSPSHKPPLCQMKNHQKKKNHKRMDKIHDESS
jgi:hypothetical protein